MAINLKKGQKVDLTKGNKGLQNILAGLGWDVNKYDGTEDFDLDASVFLLDANGKVANDSDFIFYNNPTGAGGAITHSGDNTTGAGEGDDESVKISLATVPAAIDKMAFCITIHDGEARNQTFGQVSNAYVRIVDTDTNEELIHFDLGEDFSVETAVIAGELYRHNGEWKFAAIGAGYQGGLEAVCKDYGLAVG